MQRKDECLAMLTKLEDYDYRHAFMQILMEYPVTQQDLEDIAGSDSLSDEYLNQNLSPAQITLQKMLEQNCINTQIDSRPPLNLPFARSVFDDGFNYVYQQYTKDKPLSRRKITMVLQECLGDHGKLDMGRARADDARVYWFPVKLGTLCETFKRLTGGEVPCDTKEHQETGPYQPDAPTIRNRCDVFARIDRGSASY
jgi:hypothetical protein